MFFDLIVDDTRKALVLHLSSLLLEQQELICEEGDHAIDLLKAVGGVFEEEGATAKFAGLVFLLCFAVGRTLLLE